MSKFTKGQWFVSEQGSMNLYDDYPHLFIYSDMEHYQHRIYTAIVYDDEEEAQANARLIAAAPELYALLKEELIPTSDYGASDYGRILSFSRAAKVRELLARIDGEVVNNE